MQQRDTTLKDLGVSAERVSIVSWLMVEHLTRRGLRRAVDLPSVEHLDNETGRTRVFVGVNPAAPGDPYVVQNLLKDRD